MRAKKIRTQNKEIYQKLNMLNFVPEIVLTGVKKYQVTKILKTINDKDKLVDAEFIGDKVILSKKKAINLNMYLSKRK